MEKLVSMVLGLTIIAPLFLAMIFILSAIRAITISLLWKWFIVTTFGLNPLTLLQAYGLALFVSYLTPHTHEKIQTSEDATSHLVNSLALPVVVLTIGYVVKSFM